MDKNIIKEAVREMLRDGELNLNVEVTDGSELYFMRDSDEQTVRVKVSITDSSSNELAEDSGDVTFRKK